MKLFTLAAFAVLCMTTMHASSQVAPFDVVITEIMADPTPVNGLPDAEYVEIFNRSATPVNLAGWTFYDGSLRTLPAIVLQPGKYAIICNDDDTTLFPGIITYIAVSSISLTNSGELLSLRDPAGNPIDSVLFSLDQFGSSPKQDGGWSLERIDVAFTCLSDLNWKPSEGPLGGTPGFSNSVTGTIVDPVPPVLLRAYCPDSISVELVFSEPLDSSALLKGNYSVINAPFVENVSYSSAGRSRVDIQLGIPIQPGVMGTLFASNVSDCAGNVIHPGSSARFGLADSMACEFLVINEILFHPREGSVDFIEFYNCGITIADLGALKVNNYDLESGLPQDVSEASEEPFLVFPGDHVVLTENPEAVAAEYTSSFPFRMVTIGDLPAMNVDEGIISISFRNKVVDSVYYSESYHFELLNEVQGISLEKIRPEWDGASASSWHSASTAAGSATPGMRNSQYLTGLPQSTSLSVTPEIFSPDNDGTDDVVSFTLSAGKPGFVASLQIYNGSGQVIYSQEGQLISTTNSSFTWDGVGNAGIRAHSGIYVAFIEMFHPEGDVKQYKAAFVLAGSKKQ